MDRFQNTKQPDWGWWGRLWPAPGETLRDLGLSAGDSVVEIGCGNGYFAIPSAHIVAPATVYALDLDAALLAELDTLADQQAIENLVTVEGDARNLIPSISPCWRTPVTGSRTPTPSSRLSRTASATTAGLSSSTGSTARARRRPSRASRAARRLTSGSRPRRHNRWSKTRATSH